MSLHPYESLYDTDLLAYTILHNGLTEQGLKLKKGDKVKLTKWGEYSLESEAYDIARTKQREWAYGEGDGERLTICQYVANGSYIEL